jgi:hypothetical protein
VGCAPSKYARNAFEFEGDLSALVFELLSALARVLTKLHVGLMSDINLGRRRRLGAWTLTMTSLFLVTAGFQ